MADQPRVAGSNNAMAMEAALPDGLTALHAAVLENDHQKVRALLRSRELGVNARSSTGTTPLMLATLFGRAEIFQYLLKNGAALESRDHQGHPVIDYIQGAFTRDLILRYQGIATAGPCLSGQNTIQYSLKILKYANKTSRPRRRSNILRSRNLRPPGTVLQDTPSADTPSADTPSADTPPAETPPAETPPTDTPLPRLVFLRCGKHLEVAELRRLGATEVNIVLGRKSSGIIRGKNEVKISKFAISGWAGVKGEDVLCNKSYTGLVHRICSIYGFTLGGHRLDYRWSGEPRLKTGAFFRCHAEKQLGAWVLREALAEALDTDEVTVENIARLKEISPQLPTRLRETLIELDHKPCPSCINFLRLLHKKAGLLIEWKSREWFTEGQRPRLRIFDDSSRVAGNAQNTQDDCEYEDEIVDDGYDDETYDSSVTVNQEDDDDNAATATANTDATVEDAAADPSPPLPASEGTHRRDHPRRRLRRHASDPYRKGRSPIVEPPQNNLPRWPDFNVRPIPPTDFGDQLRLRYGYNAANDRSRESSSEYDAENIVDYNPEDKKYKVQWREGSPRSTWEPVKNLANCRRLIDEYWQAIKACEADDGMEDVELLSDDS